MRSLGRKPTQRRKILVNFEIHNLVTTIIVNGTSRNKFVEQTLNSLEKRVKNKLS